MAELNPAAQAVLYAYGNEVGGIAAITSYEHRGIAAALRAAALQIENAHDGLGCLEILRLIAAELEGATPAT